MSCAKPQPRIILMPLFPLLSLPLGARLQISRRSLNALMEAFLWPVLPASLRTWCGDGLGLWSHF